MSVQISCNTQQYTKHNHMKHLKTSLTVSVCSYHRWWFLCICRWTRDWCWAVTAGAVVFSPAAAARNEREASEHTSKVTVHTCTPDSHRVRNTHTSFGFIYLFIFEGVYQLGDIKDGQWECKVRSRVNTWNLNVLVREISLHLLKWITLMKYMRDQLSWGDTQNNHT